MAVYSHFLLKKVVCNKTSWLKTLFGQKNVKFGLKFGYFLISKSGHSEPNSNLTFQEDLLPRSSPCLPFTSKKCAYPGQGLAIELGPLKRSMAMLWTNMRRSEDGLIPGNSAKSCA